MQKLKNFKFRKSFLGKSNAAPFPSKPKPASSISAPVFGDDDAKDLQDEELSALKQVCLSFSVCLCTL